MFYYVVYFEIAAFLSSIAAWGYIRRSKYLRLFPLLFIVILLVEGYESFLVPPEQASDAVLYNWQIPLQHIIYLFILYYAIERRPYKRLMLYLAASLVLFCFVTGWWFTLPGHFNIMAYCYGSISIIIGIIIKFYEMLQNPTEFNFLRVPFFYMLFAFLLFNVGTLPYFTMGEWIYSVKGYKNVIQVISDVTSVLNFILYSIYTIAFIWIIRRKGYS